MFAALDCRLLKSLQIRPMRPVLPSPIHFASPISLIIALAVASWYVRTLGGAVRHIVGCRGGNRAASVTVVDDDPPAEGNPASMTAVGDDPPTGSSPTGSGIPAAEGSDQMNQISGSADGGREGSGRPQQEGSGSGIRRRASRTRGSGRGRWRALRWVLELGTQVCMCG